MIRIYLLAARHALHHGRAEVAQAMLRRALAEANRSRDPVRGAVLRALNYARRA